jgi:methylaspartate ammonia-lyase
MRHTYEGLGFEEVTERIQRLSPVNVVEAILFEVLSFIHCFESRIMSALDDAVAALTAEVAAANGKIDQLIALAQAAGVPQASIDAITAATASLKAEEAKVDAVLTPPAPTPAP